MIRLLIIAVFLCASVHGFAQIFESTHLPLVVIQTPNNQAIVDDPRVKASMQIIYDENGDNRLGDTANIYDGDIAIELRGQTSQFLFDKKSYRLETQDENGENNNVELLGMPSENDWILQGPFSDKTLIRNVLIYDLSRRIGRHAARTRFCELFINGDYKGVYVLMENIKRDKDRVDISKLDADDTQGDSLTGGYIFRIDKFGPGDQNIWRSDQLSFTGLPIEYQIVYPKPDDLQSEQRDYIINLVTEFEDVVFQDNYQDEDGFRQYIDEDSFIDFFLLNEMARNPDAYRISTYFHKDRDDKEGKIKAGPIWDFNIAFGNVNFCAGPSHEDWILNYHNYCPDDMWQVPAWWDRLFSDPAFAQKAIDRWRQLRSDVFSTSNICSVIDSLTMEIGEAQERNFERWAILGEPVWPNFFVGSSYASEVDYMKDWLSNRLEWMDQNIEPISNSIKGSSSLDFVELSPNPLQNELFVKIQNDQQKTYTFNLLDITGKEIYNWQTTAPSGQIIKLSIPFDHQSLANGIYFMQIFENNEFLKTEKLVRVGD